MYVWNPRHPDLAVSATLVPPACVSRGICSVSFSSSSSSSSSGSGSSSLLAALSLEEARSLFIFDFKAATLLASVRVGMGALRAGE